MMYEYKLVKNWEDANILLEKGFRLKRMDKNRFDKETLVFWFYYDEGIDEELDKISKAMKLLYSKQKF